MRGTEQSPILIAPSLKCKRKIDLGIFVYLQYTEADRNVRPTVWFAAYLQYTEADRNVRPTVWFGAFAAFL